MITNSPCTNMKNIKLKTAFFQSKINLNPDGSTICMQNTLNFEVDGLQQPKSPLGVTLTEATFRKLQELDMFDKCCLVGLS